MALKDYVEFIVNLRASTVSRKGFGTALYIAETPGGGMSAGDISVRFTSIEDLVGFSTSDDGYEFAQAFFAQGRSDGLIIYCKDGGDSYVEAFQKAREANPDWWGVAIDSQGTSDVQSIAAAAQTIDCLFVTATDDAGCKDPQEAGDIASVLLAQSYNRTQVWYHSDAATGRVEARALGLVLSAKVGSQNTSYKELVGIAAENFSSPEINALRDKRCNYYDLVAGEPCTYGGFVSRNGWFVDIVRQLDFLRRRLQEDYIAEQKRESIPYFSPGPERIEDFIRRRMTLCTQDTTDNGPFINEGFDIFVPRGEDQDPVDRAARYFPNIRIDFTLKGWINEIRGEVNAEV